ncbi:dihydrofolate reductase family protein [Oryzobacter sp. R7]|uniref:dihydrofolate reductase family protein n=1 Tax=Oryzobacter faecalis TaxID=3388656 RepID=UPI00398CA170
MAGRLRVHSFTVSLDGFGTGEGLTDDEPFGHAGERLHTWMFASPEEGGGPPDGVDARMKAAHWDGIGAEIMGRRKFHVGTGPIPDEWHGFWGSEPPFHTPVIVLTHHPRPDLVMEGGTTFHFLDVTPEEALERARALAGDGDVRLGGGTETVRSFLDADLVDELHLVVAPVVLGRGQRLWDGQEALEERFAIEAVAGDYPGVTHLLLTRRG